jgi:5-methylcytosine-specific restriction endonuclease McrA
MRPLVRHDAGDPVEAPGVQPLRKPMPKVLERKLKRAAIEKHRVSIKAEVFKRDGGKCRCCGAHATEMHELRFRSLGGKRSLENSIAVCDWRANSCHQMLQRLVILAECVSANMGANGIIKFSTGDKKVWFG